MECRAGVILIVAVISQYCCSCSSDHVTLQAKVADLRRSGSVFAKNKNPNDIVQLKLPGQVLDVPARVQLIRRDQADWSTPENSIASILSANAAGNVPWMLLNYVPAERNTALKQFSDPNAVERSRESYRAMEKFERTGWVQIREFRVTLVRGEDVDGDPTLMSVALLKTPAGWKQSDALANDDTLDMVVTALHTGTVQ